MASTNPLWNNRIKRGVRIPTRDGLHVAADLYLPPVGDGPWPVVMEYQPYRKDEIDSEVSFYTYLPEHGYIVARVDIRGTGASPGTVTDEYVVTEQEDGYDAIEWLAAQSFCDGNVNMMGISYGGFTALQVATTQPPHLRSIIPMYFTDDRYRDDCHYGGGHPRLYGDIGFYGSLMVAYNALPPAPEWCENWSDVWQQHLEGNEPYILNWLRNQTDGPYWRQGSVGDIADRIQCPVFMIGGWADGYSNTPTRLYEKLTTPKRVLIGPWDHAVPDVATPGPRINHLAEVVHWLDHWCGRRESADAAGTQEAPIVVYEQHFEPPADPDRTHQHGRWRAETSWPPPGSQSQTYYLAAHSTLTPSSNNTDTSPEATDQLQYDATVGTTAGLWSVGMGFGLAGDQRLDEALSRTYTSPVLTEAVHVLGRATVFLRATTTATVLGFTANLCDVAPDGSSQLVSKGILNATRRHSMTHPTRLTPGEQFELTIDIDATSWHFQPGHRLRLSIANADWPNVWPTPEPANSILHLGGLNPSRLTLPTVPSTPSAPTPALEPAAMIPRRHAEETSPLTWRVERDMLSRQVWVKFHIDHAARVSATSTIQRSYEFCTHVDPEIPAQASTRGIHTSCISRPSGTIEAKSSIAIRGAESHFNVTISVEVKVDGSSYFNRHWAESIPRVLC